MIPFKPKKHPHVAKAVRYMADVESGKIPVCVQIHQACARLRKLAAKPGYYFDPDAVEALCEFREALPHVKGKWAVARVVGGVPQRQTLKMEPWQCFADMAFGLKRKRDGLRVIRTIFKLLPRKNGKSFDAASLGLYMMTCDGEPGAEVYCGATSEKQAFEVFTPAKRIAEVEADLVEEFEIEAFARALITPDLSSFKPVIGKPGDGSSPHCGIVDEYHEHSDSTVVDTFKTGMGARQQPLLYIITTAGSNTAGPCKIEYDYACSVLAGDIEDDTYWPIIYGIDKGDDWRDFEVWKKANPNYGVSVMPDYLEQQWRDAVNQPSKQNVNRTKHLNEWVSVRESWLSSALWRSCAVPGLKLEDFRGCDAYIGVDLAARHDIAAVVVLITQDGIDHYFPYFFAPAGVLDEGKDNPNLAAYRDWVARGYMQITTAEVAEIDQLAIKAHIEWIASVVNVVGLAYDQWNAMMLMQMLDARGVETYEWQMSYKWMSSPMREFETAVESRKLRHPDNPVFNWMVENVVAYENADGHRRPGKPQRQKHKKIDGAVAAIAAKGLSMSPEVAPANYGVIVL